MPYPDIFYYLSKKNEAHYSFNPQGQLNADRMVNGRPYWKNPHPEFELKKKSLVLGNCRTSD